MEAAGSSAGAEGGAAAVVARILEAAGLSAGAEEGAAVVAAGTLAAAGSSAGAEGGTAVVAAGTLAAAGSSAGTEGGAVVVAAGTLPTAATFCWETVKQVHASVEMSALKWGGAINAGIVAVQAGVDFYYWCKGKEHGGISGKEFAENTVRNATCAVCATGAGYLGAMTGGLIATALGASATGIGLPIAAGLGSLVLGIAAWQGISWGWKNLFHHQEIKTVPAENKQVKLFSEALQPFQF